MSDENTHEQLGPQVRTMQIIVFALCMGIVMFGGFVLLGGQKAEPDQSNTLTLAAICFAVMSGVIGLVVPGVVADSQRKKIADGTWKPANPQNPAPDTDAGKLAAIYQLKIIIRAAFFEGPAFLALLAYMTEGHLISLAVAAAMLLGLMAQFPTVGRVEAWIDTQLQRMEEQRQFLS